MRLTELPTELLRQILEDLVDWHCDWEADCINFMCTCRLIESIARPILLRHIGLSTDDEVSRLYFFMMDHRNKDAGAVGLHRWMLGSQRT